MLDLDGFEHRRLLQALDRSFLMIDWRNPGSRDFYDSIFQANEKLKMELDALPKMEDVTIRCIGHTHIDVAWLWRLKHTREKAARSFSTVLHLMEQFPEYIFLQTQPQLYDDLQYDYPELYRRIEKSIDEGRWEAGGAMWLEADCNIPSGESLVRQLVYGQRFFEKHFGVQCEYLWLPDVFGYSWALPQILKKAGLRYFMTTKISWNVYNRFPHDTFFWRGIDGTEILTHYITTPDPTLDLESTSKFYTYNGDVMPETVMGIWRDYRDKEINDELLLSYGYGDGGGGPTRSMLEMRRRLEHMPGLPKVVTGRADTYFQKLEENVSHSDRYVHKWDGELYLELHRGTYTSQAYNKKMNRIMENMLHNAEMAATFLSTIAGYSHYPSEKLYDCWKIVLRNQFHDILPGSSISEVYEDCHVEYAEAEMLASGTLMKSMEGLTRMIDNDGTPTEFIFNGLPWSRNELIEVEVDETGASLWTDFCGSRLITQDLPKAQGNKQLVMVHVPALGYTTIQRAPKTEKLQKTTSPSVKNQIIAEKFNITTPFYDIEWNESGQLTRIYDKSNAKEVLSSGEIGNRFDVHEDKPVAHDAWDIDIFYYEKVNPVSELKSVEVIESGPLRGIVRFKWIYGRSEIRQELIVFADHPRIDFSTEVTWNEPQQLLKVAFPVNIRSTQAVYEIQFGNVKRPTHWNTSWDYAQFETCAQRWIDLSERDYGISLLNDCKYGHDVIDNVMRLTLIKAAISPDAGADIGEHKFTYSLFPHAGDWYEGNTQVQAQRLNSPVLHSSIPKKSEGSLNPIPNSLSFFSCSNDHVVIDTIKKAEDSEAWIVRCYEYGGKRGNASFNSYYEILQIEEVDLMERVENTIDGQKNGFNDFFKPYELKTYQIHFKAEKQLYPHL